MYNTVSLSGSAVRQFIGSNWLICPVRLLSVGFDKDFVSQNASALQNSHLTFL